MSRTPEDAADRAARRRLIALLLRRGDIGTDLLRESRTTTLASDAGAGVAVVADAEAGAVVRPAPLGGPAAGALA